LNGDGTVHFLEYSPDNGIDSTAVYRALWAAAAAAAAAETEAAEEATKKCVCRSSSSSHGPRRGRSRPIP